MRRFALLSVVAGLAACQDQPPQASSRLSRPSGLAYVARSEARADLFIADAEARGVRVLQLAKFQATDGRLVDDQVFLAGPVIFFPLVIPAFDFPTAVSPSTDGQRLYVLSPVGPSMHVLDVREAPYGQSAELVEGYVPLAEFDLEALRGVLGLVDLIGPDAVAVDLDVIPSAGVGDRVAVTYDRVLSPESLVVVFEVSGAEQALSLVATATVAPGPRRAEVRRATPAGLLLSSVASSTVSFLPFSQTATQGVFRPHRGLFAGGPTTQVVDAGEAGVLALRLDRASVVSFEATAGRLTRSRRLIGSPFTPELEQGSVDLYGRIDTFPRTLRAGAHGVVSSLASSVSFPTGTATDAVALVHVDGTVSFLVGRPLSLSLANRASVSTVTRRRADGADLVGCEEQDDLAGDELCPLDRPAACEPGVLARELGRLSAVRVEYEGSLVVRDAGRLLASTSTVPNTLVLSDPGVSRFGARRVQAGHRVLAQYRGPAACDGEAIEEWSETGRVVEVSETASELVVAFEAGSPFLSAEPCEGALPLRRYQVYPPGQVVVSELRQDETARRVAAVLEVEPDAAGGQKVSLAGALAGTLVAPAGFSCAEGPVALAPARCESNADCGGAICRTAEASAAGDAASSRVCGRFCAACTEADPTCFRGFVVRRCTGVDLALEPARVTATNPRSLAADPVTTLPEDLVFSPIRESWIYSLPGARALAEVRTLTGADGQPVFGGTPEIRASSEAR